MFPFKRLSERVRFIIISLIIIFLPFLSAFFINFYSDILKIKNNFEKSSENIFSDQDPYVHWEIKGPIVYEGFIRFKDKISLEEIVKRAGGTKRDYYIPKNIKESDHEFGSELLSNLELALLDLTDYLKKKTYFKQNIQYSKLNRTYHDKIKESSKKYLGERNGRKSRYR